MSINDVMLNFQVNGTDGRLSHWKVPDDDASLRLQRETDFLK